MKMHEDVLSIHYLFTHDPVPGTKSLIWSGTGPFPFIMTLGPAVSDDAQRALVLLRQRGVLSSPELQALLGRSQPTVSRLMAALGSQAAVLGAARSTRYALLQPILGFAARQPIAWVHEDGRIDERWGQLTFIAGERVHVQAQGGIDGLLHGTLPWWLAPLRPSGFLGRLLARRLALPGVDPNPERWPIEQLLYAALRTPDAPGAIVLGEAAALADAGPAALTRADVPAAYDRFAADVAATLPAGSSAAGEQAKFVARVEDRHAIVKFSPPRGTPFGERWHDLLHAEALAQAVLGEHGVPAAQTSVIETRQRTYLESTRFDRVGASGRRHGVALDALHEAFVSGPRQHWAATCEVLASQRRLPADAPAQARALLQFGRLIGNSDMHFGNLGVVVEPGDVARGRFKLAPVYDMLPMRWRPDPQTGELGLTPFEPASADLATAARPVALEFWHRVAGKSAVSAGFRALAREMTARLA